MKVWHHFITGGSSILSEKATIEALIGTGMTVCAYERAGQDCPGILFFDEVCREVYDFLREASHNGSKRVLAVASKSAALMNGVAWNLLRAGASDAFAWEQQSDPAAEAAARFERWESIDRIVDSPLVRDNLAGESAVWKTMLRRVVEVARFTDIPILILGESGTGKELLARLIHTLDARPDKGELIILDCTTIVPELSGSEFFGHERGSYTGATNARDGAFALADKGTLFLDEVGELSPRLQSELLRVTQEHSYKRIGSNSWKQADFRLVCATNRNLRHEEEQGQFRGDFFHRIAGWTCVLPPLRERAGDVLRLAEHFIRFFRPHDEPLRFDESVREYLMRREYRGNVRELKALIASLVKRHAGTGPITVGDIIEEERPAPGDAPWDWRDAQFEQAIRRAVSLNVGLKEIGNAATETAMHIAVSDEGGNLQRAARRLGVTDRALQIRRAVQREEQKQAELPGSNGKAR